MKKRNKLLKGKELIHLMKKTHHKVRRRGVMTIKKLLNRKQMNHLIKRTPQKKKTNPENKSTKNRTSQDNKKSKPTASDEKRAFKSTSGKKTTETEEKNTQKMVYHCSMPKCNRLKFDDEQLYF